MSQSLADLFASGTVKKKPDNAHPVDTHAILHQGLPLAYPAAESESDVIPPDEGKPITSL